MDNSNPSWQNISIFLCTYMHTSLCMYCSTLGALYTDHPSQHALLSTPQKKFMQTLSFRNFRLILAQGLINHTFWCLFTHRLAPFHLYCLQRGCKSQQLPPKFTRISRSFWHAPSFFLTYAAHGVLLCPGCLCVWNLWVRMEPLGGSILDRTNFIWTLQNHLPT